jgi:hypothetical protein
MMMMMMILIGSTGTASNHSDNTWATYCKCMKSRNYKKQPYLESANVKVQNILNVQNNVTRSTNFRYPRNMVVSEI